MPDIPEAYIGQPRRHEPDPFTTDTDMSNPAQPGRERGPMDALDPERPCGAQETGKPDPKRRPRVRWYRGRR